MLLHYQAVELRRSFLGDAADQTDIFMVQLFQRSIIAVIILANQLTQLVIMYKICVSFSPAPPVFGLFLRLFVTVNLSRRTHQAHKGYFRPFLVIFSCARRPLRGYLCHVLRYPYTKPYIVRS